jgi:hypothetical protein
MALAPCSLVCGHSNRWNQWCDRKSLGLWNLDEQSPTLADSVRPEFSCEMQGAIRVFAVDSLQSLGRSGSSCE